MAKQRGRYRSPLTGRRVKTRTALKLKRKRRNPVSLAPIRKLLNEAKTRRVRVMRSKSGKPTGLKFL